MPPSEPLYWTVWSDIVTSLEAMGKANGDWYDYGGVAENRGASVVQDPDRVAPTLGLEWTTEVTGDEIHGGERATTTTDRFARFRVSVAIVDVEHGEHLRKAWRVMRDVHRAMVGQTSNSSIRKRGLNRAMTFENDPEWSPLADGGGVLFMNYTVRFSHTTGDMTTEA
jgi:hypothetical protein